MPQENKKHKKEDRKEPKISEIEKIVGSFRGAHGHDKLLKEIKNATSHYKKTSEKDRENQSKQEPKISEIEKIFHLFRQEHGHKKLEESVASATENTKENQKIRAEDARHIVYKATKQQGEIKTVNTREVLRSLKNIFWGIPAFIKNKLKYKRYRYPSLALGALAGIYLLFNLPLIYARITWEKPVDTQKFTVKTEEVVQKKMADSAALAPGEVIPADSRLVIPKIGVNVPIVYANTKDEKTIQEMLHSGVVHYQDTAKPGEVGNSFITGHSSNYWWDAGKYNQVFLMLDKLGPGDQAIVYHQGKKFVYIVRDKVVVAPEDLSVLAPADTPVLSLMTCTPPGTSWKRLVVRFDRTDPVYHKPETVTNEKIVEVPKEEKKKSLLSGIFSLFVPN